MKSTSKSARPVAKSRTQAASSSPTGASIAKQGAKFGVVGISNTVIDYTLYITLTTLLHVPVGNVYIVKFFSGSVAMVNSFYWNRRWVFASRAHVGASGLKFLTATLVSVFVIQPSVVRLFSATDFGVGFGSFWYGMAQTLGLASLLPSTITEEFVIKTVAFGMGVIGSAIWNFTLYKLWAFREKA